MKTAILIADGVKQVMFTPENDHEKEVLALITPNEDVHTVKFKDGSFSDLDNVFGVDIYKCQGGYYRAERKEGSVMFVLTPKKDKTT